MIIEALWGLLLGIIIGMVVSHWGWCARLAEKSRNGFRLEAGGKLYEIKESRP